MTLRGVIGRRLIFQKFSGNSAPALAWFGGEPYAEAVRPQAASISERQGTGLSVAVATRYGRGVAFTGSSAVGEARYLFTTLPEKDSISFFWIGAHSASSSLGRVVSGYPGRYDIYADSGFVQFQCFRSIATGQWNFSGAGWSDSTVHTFAITYDGNSTANDPLGYIDGVSATPSEASAPAGSLNAAATSYCVGGRPDVTTRQLNGSLYLVLRFDRVLSVADIKWMHANAARLAEWQWDLVPVSAGGTAFKAAAYYYQMIGSHHRA